MVRTDPLGVELVDLDSNRSDALFSHSFEQNKKNERPYLPRKQA
jgi:hypothetical protein